MQQVMKSFGNYVISILLVLLSLFFIAKYASSDAVESQPAMMLVGGLFLLLAGVISMPAVSSRINGPVAKIVLIVGLIVSGYLGYNLYEGVSEEIEFQAETKAFNSRTIQRLKDIRTAEEQYLTLNGRYTDNFDTLLAFINAEVLPIPFQDGQFSDSLLAIPQDELIAKGFLISLEQVDQTASDLGMSVEAFKDAVTQQKISYVIKDTTYSSVYREYFSPEIREKKKMPLMYVDSLPFSPYSGERFILKTGRVNMGGVQKATILVKDPKPFGREKVRKDTLQFGSLTEAHTDGNWRAE